MLKTLRPLQHAGLAATIVMLSLSGAALADVTDEAPTPESADTVYVNRPDTHETDRELTQKVTAALSADPALKGETIAVSTQNGVLRLSGEMSSVAMIYRVIETSRKVQGVRRINDNDLM